MVTAHAEVLLCSGTDRCWVNRVHIQDYNNAVIDYNNAVIGFPRSGLLEQELSFNLLITLVILLSRRPDGDQDLPKASTIL